MALILVTLTGAYLLAGCGDKGEPVLTGHPGYPAYKKHCRKCHGNEGDGQKASRMARRNLDLGHQAYGDTTSLDDVVRVVREGQGRMKGYQTKLARDELDAVSRYVLEMSAAASP